jgi:hypothetical protein
MQHLVGTGFNMLSRPASLTQLCAAFNDGGRSGEIREHDTYSRSIFCVIFESFGFRNASGDHQTGPIMDVPELSNRARLVLMIGNLDD